MTGGRRRGLGALAVLVCLAVPLAGCSTKGDTFERTAADRSPDGSSGSSGSAQPQPSGGSAQQADFAVADPGSLKGRLLTPDLLITSTKPIPESVRKAVADVRGVDTALPISVSSLSVNGRTLSIAAGDPAQFRRFTPYQSAKADAVWKRVAGGEIAVDPSLPRKLEEKNGYLRLGTTEDAPTVHIGAYAPMVKSASPQPAVSAVVNEKRARQLGMPKHNALLVSTGELTPSKVTGSLKKVLGKDIAMQTLALEFDDMLQAAVLTGSSVTSKVGTFNYRPNPNGTVTPEASWVKSYIRREQVPLLGTVTCNKGMLPQLRAALTEIVQQGLADKIHPNEYAGCYYPRFIANDPGKGLSLHSWGIAVDLNVPGNQRGTVGQMDRRVVAIFKRWGFAWGGDWNYTDPMHFEMAKVVEVGGS